MRILGYIGWGLLGLLFLAAGLMALQIVASERVEVVELHTVDPAGEFVTTRLWVVDHAGKPYLRVGVEGSDWYERMLAHPEIELTRRGERQTYLAVPKPGDSVVINTLMQEKYTWGDAVIGVMIGGRDGSIPIELQQR